MGDAVRLGDPAIDPRGAVGGGQNLVGTVVGKDEPALGDASSGGLFRGTAHFATMTSIGALCDGTGR